MAKQPLVAANTAFAFKLFAELNRQEHGKNIFISPISVALALSMAYNGARGDTARAMAEALELGGMSLEELNRANADLLSMLTSLDRQVTLTIANSLWARQDILFNSDFMRQNAEFYHAEITSLDFDSPESVRRINSWVDQQTDSKISAIIDQLDPLALMLLINAIYFKGTWSIAFDKSLTKDLPFSLLDGSQKPVPMMRRTGEWHFYWDGMIAGISVPYGIGRTSMDIFLPDQQGGLDAFYRLLNQTNWQIWTRQFRKAQGTLVLPRFKLEYEVKLNSVLAAIGMSPAFDRKHANFTGITESVQTSISQVKHKSFVEVNEEGTEAAAVTSVEIRALGMVMHPERKFTLIVDRPFFCTIRDTQTGALLFMGSIVDPN